MLSIKTILLSNYFMALVIALPIAISIRGIHKKYTVKTELVESYDKTHYVQYYDLDGDGNSEEIVLLDNQKGNGCLKIYNPAFVGQFNAMNQLFIAKEFTCNDFDNDGIGEVYFLGIRNDSIFLNQYVSSTDFISEFLVDTIKPNADIIGSVNDLYDLNQDTFKEAIFHVNAGYALVPRKIYAFNLKEQKLLHTPFVGAKFGRLNFVDLDMDGKTEICTNTSMPMNYGSRPVPYSDLYSWMMVFDDQLQFKFEPIQFSDQRVSSHVLPFKLKNKNYVMGIHSFRKNRISATHYMVVNKSGEIICADSIFNPNPREFDYRSRIFLPFPDKKSPVIYIDFDGNIFKMNTQFKFIKSHQISELNYSYYGSSIDINGDKTLEHIFRINGLNRYIVTDNKLKHWDELDLTSDPNMQDVFSIRHHKGKKPTLIMQKGFNIYEITYRKNIFWQWRFFIYLFIYAMVLGFIHLIRYTQRIQLKRQFEAKQKIHELQFKLITAQLNPHFTFNALNSFSKAVYELKQPELYDQFTSFSRLIRNTLTDTYKISRTLNEELKLSRDFLHIQQMRFKDQFTYDIHIDKDVNQEIGVPKMIMQLFIENSIKHAFPNNKGYGHIQINIRKRVASTEISIQDNGIGREASKQLKKSNSSTGVGIKVMNDYLSSLNRKNYHKLTFQIKDLKNGKTAKGTEVIIRIPDDYQY